MTTAEPDDAELMVRFGILKVPTYRYHYRDWQYSNLADAFAQAMRDVASANRKPS
jgi:hypothetical protein